ncbi:unnamed protein product [Thelazia callipaeda]|uniref:DnaJ homolog subfamily C member 8 n=1 Tax=Thelazia callipaeda TaxID=103827 RepID=A0A0N5D1A4_THECL|nr:unnamed protein product [Thelazia callipaeda]
MGDATDFERFYSDLKETERKDSVLTSKQQIDRLLRPGSTYLNLNPFEVILKMYMSLFDLPILIYLVQSISLVTDYILAISFQMSEKRRKLKKSGQGDKIPEDEPAAYNKALWVVVTKVFADREKKRKMLEDRANEEKRRIAEEMLAAAEKRKREEEFAKNYEESRDERRGTWRQFMAKKARKEGEGKSLKGTAFKPPKIKLETSGK